MPFKPAPRLAWQVGLLRGPGEGLNINEPPRASRPALPRRACRAWASSSDPVGLLQAPACQTKLIAPMSTSLPAAPSPRSPPWGSTQGVKISGSPWLLGGAEEAPIKVLMGKETYTHTRAWVEESRLEIRHGAARLDPLPTLLGTWWRRWATRFSRLSLALRG